MTKPPVLMPETPDWEEKAMDALSDVLRIVQLSGAVYLNGEFTSPWRLVNHADSEVCAGFLPPADRVRYII